MNSNIAVTGASGHIGNVVCRILFEKGYKVRAMYNSSRASLENIDIEKVKGDILNIDDLNNFFDGCDVVINCAAIISIHGDPTGKIFKTNTEGPKKVLEACKLKGVKKLIHISSVHAVMEFPLDTPLDENRPYKAKGSTPYDYSKAVAEQLLLEGSNDSSPEIIILRPSSVVGPFDFKPSEMGKALIDFYNNKIPAIPEGGYDFVDVRDVAISIITAMEKGKHGEIYLLSGKFYTLNDLVKLVHKVTKKQMPGVVIPYFILRLVLPCIRLYSKLTGGAPVFTRESIDILKYGHPKMDHSKATAQLGHNVRSLEESLKDFYDWHFRYTHHLSYNKPLIQPV